ncbi:c-type cytochrome [Roseibium marinum]|uniref:Cytochrome c556 n=1 Tax=Roseibium marinum TaxID=281252 RepID=A0A2S3UVI1_9HYPH|nr:cytochrome c [Roseibium marinum]POF31735.1 cytochrome c556 [Roseibium marinum]
MHILRKAVALSLIAGLGLAGAVAQAAADPIATRQAIMSSVGAAAGLGGGMMKGEIAYTPAAGKAAITTMRAASLSYGNFFPAGSDHASSDAADAVWNDAEGFAAQLAKFAVAAAAAAEASGKSGPADIDAFKAVFGPVLGTCKSCHETYRKQN